MFSKLYSAKEIVSHEMGARKKLGSKKKAELCPAIQERSLAGILEYENARRSIVEPRTKSRTIQKHGDHKRLVASSI